MRRLLSARMVLLVIGYVGIIVGAVIALLGLITAGLAGPGWTAEPRVADAVKFLILCGISTVTVSTVLVCRAEALREYQELRQRLDQLLSRD